MNPFILFRDIISVHCNSHTKHQHFSLSPPAVRSMQDPDLLQDKFPVVSVRRHFSSASNTHFLLIIFSIVQPFLSWLSNGPFPFGIFINTFFTAKMNTYLLTPWSRVLLEKLTGSAASQEIPRIFGTRRFITVLTTARHLSLS